MWKFLDVCRDTGRCSGCFARRRAVGLFLQGALIWSWSPRSGSGPMVGTPCHQVEVLVDTSLIRDVCFFFFALIGQGLRWPADRPGPPSVKPLMCRSARLIASFVRESLCAW